jgi:hypothetical protein
MNCSCVILAKNEIYDVSRLASQFDEVIVLVDAPIKPSRETHIGTSSVVIAFHPLDNDFSAQRNFGLSLCTKPWVFFLDEDEELSESLVHEMAHAITSPIADAFLFHRRDVFMGRELHHGETAHVQLLRLARRTSGKWERPVHEVWNVQGTQALLHHPLLHRPHTSITTFIEKIDQYTTIEASLRKKAGKKFSLFELLLFPPAKFLQNSVLRLGVLDGFPGIAMAYMMSLHSLIVRVKMYEPS